MTENEAIKTLKNDSCYECGFGGSSAINCGSERCNVAQATEKAIQALSEIQQYRAIGTIDELQALKEKSMAKKVVRQGYAFLCPECKRSTLDGMGLKSDCCPKCGQKLDWSE